MVIPDRHGEGMESSEDIAAKIRAIHSLLNAEGPNIDGLRQMCVLPGGLLTNSLRRRAWPQMLGIRLDQKPDEPSEEQMKEHRDYRVVELDVERLLKRYPPHLDQEERSKLEQSLKRIIMRSIWDTDYYYYQGFHDIAITVHLVLEDEDLSVAVLRKLCHSHLKVFMMPTLLDTVMMLQYIYPLIQRCNPTLHDFMIRSDIGTMFALPWLITWYGHNIQENSPHTLVVRLCDLFIASDPYMPVYLGAAIVSSLSHHILALHEDQAEVHGFLNTLPTTLSWELLIKDALDLYLQFPPAKIAREAEQVQGLLDSVREKKYGRPKKQTNPKELEIQSWWLKAGIIASVAVVVLAIAVVKYYKGTNSEQVEEATKTMNSKIRR